MWCETGRSLYWCIVCSVNEQHEQRTYCGVRQGAACIGAKCIVLMSNMNSELIGKYL